MIANGQKDEGGKALENIRKFYSGPEMKHVKGRMTLDNSVTGKRMDNVDFEYWIQDKYVLSKMNYVEILRNENLYLMINHKRKTIYARPVSSLKKTSATGIFDMDQLKQLLDTKGAGIQLIKKDSVSTIILTGLGTSNFSSVAISYYNKDYRIRSIEASVTQGREKGENLLLRVDYLFTEKTKVSGTDVFSDSQYVTKSKGNQISFTNKFQDYKKL